MSEILYYLVGVMARFHDRIMEINNDKGWFLTDKMLHFLVMGIVGMVVCLIAYWLFKALGEKHMLVIAFIYAITVMVVLTFAVEIGQGISGTGAMEMEDVQAGLSGFLMMFVVYAAIRFVVLKVYGWITGGDESDRRAKH